MNAVTLSPKSQVVIPKEIRDAMHLKSGQKIQVLHYENRIELIPIKPMKEMQGFLKGMNSSFIREKKDRL